jgi:hypothetical protein
VSCVQVLDVSVGLRVEVGERHAEAREFVEIDPGLVPQLSQIAERQIFGDTELARRVLGNEVDGAADGVPPEQRALRPAQDLDLLQVGEVENLAASAGDIDAIDIEADAAVRLHRAGVVALDAAKRQPRGGAVAVHRGAAHYVEVGHRAGEIGRVQDSGVRQGGRTERGHRHRDHLLIFAALLRRDDDLFQRSRTGRRWSGGLLSRSGRMAERGDRRAGQYTRNFIFSHRYPPHFRPYQLGSLTISAGHTELFSRSNSHHKEILDPCRYSCWDFESMCQKYYRPNTLEFRSWEKTRARIPTILAS